MNLPTPELHSRLQEALSLPPHPIPTRWANRGTGTPGRYLEHLLQIYARLNPESPDFRLAGGWELKYHGDTNPITLFRKEPSPRGRATRQLVEKYGKPGTVEGTLSEGNISFRRTVRGKTGSLWLEDDGEKIVLRDPHLAPEHQVEAYWDYETLMERFQDKLSNLILVRGQFNPASKLVNYTNASYFTDLELDKVLYAIKSGLVFIDFNVWRKPTGALRNHGTEFRITPDNLRHLYRSQHIVR